MRLSGLWSEPLRSISGSVLSSSRAAAIAFAALFIAVFAASLLGIASRPAGQLASIWPADAIMIGLMLRFPAFSGPAGWLGGASGYVLADAVTHHSLTQTMVLSGANLWSVAVGMWVLSRLDEVDRRLRRPTSVLHIACGSAATAAAAGLAGSIVNPALFGQSWLDGLLFWFAGELLAFVTVLPVVLTMQPIAWAKSLAGKRLRRREDRRQIAPFAALALSIVVALLLPGPGSFAIPVAALLWCGLSYSIATTALLTAFYSYYTLIAITTGLLPMHLDLADPHASLPIRVTIALMALAPVTVAAVMAGRNELLAQLRHMADHDPLTGLLNRRAFAEGVTHLLSAATPGTRGTAFLMIDIDHFKQVNDRIGHTGGDEVLKVFAQAARAELRAGEMVARMGGEEFAILLPDCRDSDALLAIDRLRERFADSIAASPLRTPDGERPVITFSAGVAITHRRMTTIDGLHRDADQALLRAKREGRNRTITVTTGD